MTLDAPLAGQTCVVTGASSGIGRAIALQLARAGADVCAVGRRHEALEAMAATNGTAGRIAPQQADLTIDTEIVALADTVEGRGVDVLVHAGGAFGMGTIDATPVEELDRLYAVNVRGPYLVTQTLLPAVRAARGQIVFVNSTVVRTARAEVGAYAATKHALKALADTLREELSADDVRVVSVFPGRTATPMQEQIYALEGRPYVPERLLQPEELAALVLRLVTLPREAEVTDVQVRAAVKP